MVALDNPVLESCVYELPGDRFLLVFGGVSGLAGQGDIYVGDDFRRFVRWSAKIEEDARHGSPSSVSHWAHYSRLKDRSIFNVDGMVAQFRSTISRTPVDLDFSYKRLDLFPNIVTPDPTNHGVLPFFRAGCFSPDNTSLAAADGVWRRIDSAPRTRRLKHWREAGAVTGYTFDFGRTGRFLDHAGPPRAATYRSLRLTLAE